MSEVLRQKNGQECWTPEGPPKEARIQSHGLSALKNLKMLQKPQMDSPRKCAMSIHDMFNVS